MAALVVFALGQLLEPPPSVLIVSLTVAGAVLVLDMVGIGSNWPRRHLSPGRISILAGVIVLLASLLAFRNATVAYVTATSITLLLEIILLFLAYRSRGNTMLESMQAHLQRIEALLGHEHIALTATCFPFQQDGDGRILLYLIQNPNFDRWWLAPGAHCDHGGDGFAFPDEVAVHRCFEEAGLLVHLVNALPAVPDDYEDCHPRKAPHFAYALDILPTAKCHKRQHHTQHYDLTFVGEVKEVRNEFTLPRLVVPLEPNWDAGKVAEAIQGAVRRWRKEHAKPMGGEPYPPDFPARVAVALQVFVNRTSASL